LIIEKFRACSASTESGSSRDSIKPLSLPFHNENESKLV